MRVVRAARHSLQLRDKAKEAQTHMTRKWDENSDLLSQTGKENHHQTATTPCELCFLLMVSTEGGQLCDPRCGVSVRLGLQGLTSSPHCQPLLCPLRSSVPRYRGTSWGSHWNRSQAQGPRYVARGLGTHGLCTQPQAPLTWEWGWRVRSLGSGPSR